MLEQLNAIGIMFILRNENALGLRNNILIVKKNLINGYDYNDQIMFLITNQTAVYLYSFEVKYKYTSR